MGISAFLPLPMAQENEKVGLRLVDEKPESITYVRLEKESFREVEELPPVKLGADPEPVRLDSAAKEDLRIRSSEPDVRALIEIDLPLPEDPWENQSEEISGVPWGWVILITCLFCAAIVWSLVNVNKAEVQRKNVAQDARAILEEDVQEELEAAALIETLESTVRDFFDSRSLDEMLRYVRHPERVKPLMERHYGEGAPEPKRVLNIRSLEPFTIEKRADFWMVSCELSGGTRTQMLLEAISNKEAKVDWETFVCHQPMPWDEFARSRPGGYTGDFRVYLQKDNFHSHEFADSETYDCYRLTALNSEEPLFGYVDRDTALAPRIAELTAGKKGKPQAMILRLHLPEGLDSPRGVIVRELVNPRWLFVSDPGTKEP